MSLLSWLLVVLAGLSLAAMVVSLTIASRSAREARSTIFPIVREEETVRARRARIVSSVTGVIAAIMAGTFFLSGQLSSLNLPTVQLPSELVAVVESPEAETGVESPSIQAEPSTITTETPPPPAKQPITPTREQMVLPSSQPLAGQTPSPAPTPTPAPPTATPTLAASATSTGVPPSPTATRPPIPAPSSVEMGPIAFATQITRQREPISPTTVFSNTASRVYASFPYSGMRNDLTWTQIWYFNDVEFSRGNETWEWGSADRSFVFTNLVGAGDYRLELYVNDDLVASGKFTVMGPVAIGGPQTPENTGTPETPATEVPGSTATPQSP
jgi:predicted secreted protein